MDNFRLIHVVKQFPQVWDRNCAGFREKELKRAAWERIGESMSASGTICKDTFKSLREKYIREREKQNMFADKYIPWQHLESLAFLDPHIVLRKQSMNYEEDLQKAEEYKTAFTGDSALLLHFSDVSNGHGDFDRTLIALVHKASPIWDRKSNSYPSKQLKYQLWKTIAQTLNRDVDLCMIRWKGLREKYIRQKIKFQEGEGKWEFLDEMGFLDKVIQYRRKQSEMDSPYPPPNHNNTTTPNHFQFGPSSNDSYHHTSATTAPFIAISDGSVNNDSSSSDFMAHAVKNEDFATAGDGGFDNFHHNHDSSYDSGTAVSGTRKRSASNHSESSSPEKKNRIEDCSHRTPEQMFGALVGAMLAKKTEQDKNFAMMEIMKVLTK